MLAERNRQQIEAYMLHHNTELLDELAVDDCLIIAAIGLVEGKDNILKTVRNLAIEDLSITDDEVRAFGDTTIIINTVRAKGTIMGRPLPSPMRFMSVYVGDKLVARSMTPIQSPPNRT